MALTMPAGVGLVTLMAPLLTPPTVRFRLKAVPVVAGLTTLSGVARSAKLLLAVRWAKAVCKTSML